MNTDFTIMALLLLPAVASGAEIMKEVTSLDCRDGDLTAITVRIDTSDRAEDRVTAVVEGGRCT
jgi:hypothetical protein